MRRWMGGALALVVATAACETGNDVIFVDGDPPAAPRSVDAYYFDRAVFVTWELAPSWDGESFRIYSKRAGDPEFFLIADVTNCSGGFCSYTDRNVRADITYDYFVSAVDQDSGAETDTEVVSVFVPRPVPPPTPGQMDVVALDGATYLRWDEASRAVDDFSFYRVYLVGDGTDFLLGETDSEGFLDERAENGFSYTYFVTAVDELGHEGEGSGVATGTPRPDFHNEWVWDYFDRPALSGFRFREDESVDPVVDGDAGSRHFRLETDAGGWWLVPGPGTEIHPSGFETTTLRCGPGADATCTSLDVAPTGGYTTDDVGLFPQTSYALRVVGDDGAVRYGVIRVELLGFDQNGDGIMIFDWAYQLQAGNPNLAPLVDSRAARGRAR